MHVSLQFFDHKEKPLMEYWTPTLAYYAMYEWPEIAEISKELLVMIQKTSNAPDDAKLMAVRKKYSNKKFGMVSVRAQKKVNVFAAMLDELAIE